MDAKEGQQQQEKIQQQLDQASARLQSLDAEAQKRNADGAKAEISSLNTVKDQIRDQIQKLQDADESSRDQMRQEIQQRIASLSELSDTTAEHLSGFDELGDEEQLDAEVGQLASAVEVIVLRLDDEAIEDADFGQDVRDELTAVCQDMTDAQQAMGAVSDDNKSEQRGKLREALSAVKQRVERIVSKLKSRREEQQAEQHP
jgi:uncharacterized protein YjbJ (UPF0337 family)